MHQTLVIVLPCFSGWNTNPQPSYSLKIYYFLLMFFSAYSQQIWGVKGVLQRFSIAFQLVERFKKNSHN